MGRWDGIDQRERLSFQNENSHANIRQLPPKHFTDSMLMWIQHLQDKSYLDLVPR